MRPVTPSRRNEKNRDASSTVHQAPPLTCVTPAARRRSRASPGRSASQRIAPSGRGRGTKCAAAAPKASSTSAPTSNWRGPMQGPSQASSSPRRAAPPPRTAPRTRGLEHAAGQAAPAGMRGADAARRRARQTAPAGSRPPAPCRRRRASVVTAASARRRRRLRAGPQPKHRARHAPGADRPEARPARPRSGAGSPPTAAASSPTARAEVQAVPGRRR